jgi:hypothetical protein
MRTKTILTLALAVAFVGSMPLAAADHFGTPAREASYVGASHVNHGLNEHWIPACESVFGAGDCPSPIPSGIISTSCDDSSWNGLGLFQGVGGVLFCSVPGLRTIGVALHDELNDSPSSRITCLHSEGQVSWHVAIAQAAPTAVVTLPATCAPHSADPAGTTRVGVFNSWPPDGTGATSGVVTLNFL